MKTGQKSHDILSNKDTKQENDVAKRENDRYQNKTKKIRPKRNDFRPVHATSYLLFRTNKSQIYIVFTVTVV